MEFSDFDEQDERRRDDELVRQRIKKNAQVCHEIPFTGNVAVHQVRYPCADKNQERPHASIDVIDVSEHHKKR